MSKIVHVQPGTMIIVDKKKAKTNAMPTKRKKKPAAAAKLDKPAAKKKRVTNKEKQKARITNAVIAALAKKKT